MTAATTRAVTVATPASRALAGPGGHPFPPSPLMQLGAVAQVTHDRFLPVHASTVGTPQLALFTGLVEDCLAEGGLLLIDGKPGTGKTHARHLLAEHLAPDAVAVQVPDNDKRRSFLLAVHTALDPLTSVRRLTDDDLDARIVRLLHRRLPVLVLDECHYLKAAGIAAIRHWFDGAPKPGLPAVLLGDGIRAIVASNTHLSRRPTGRMTFCALPDELLVEALRDFHWLYATTPTLVIHEVNRVFARGRWGHWAWFTTRCLGELGHPSAPLPCVGIDSDVALASLYKLGETAAINSWQLP